ncbi:hypothetical protein AM593_05332, partial [Mytilus galloprovincialis]
LVRRLYNSNSKWVRVNNKNWANAGIWTMQDLLDDQGKADYTFINVKQGRYRVFVQPYDDKWNSLNDCRCKSELGRGCTQCVKTMTAVIVVPRSEDLVMTSELQSSTASTSQSQKTAAETDQTINHVLPTVLGFVAFLLVVVIIVGCYLLHKERDQSKLQPKQPEPTKNNTCRPNIFLTESTNVNDDDASIDIIFHPPSEIRSEDLSLGNLMDQVYQVNADYLPGNDKNEITSHEFCQ